MEDYRKKINEIEEDMMQGASEHLTEKYGEEFKLFSYFGFSMDVDFGEAFFTSESFPDKYIKVICRLDGIYSDNYYGILKNDEFSDIIKEAAAEYFPDAKIFTKLTANGFPNDLDRSAPLNYAVKRYPMAFISGTNIFCTNDLNDPSQKLNAFCADLDEQGLRGNVSLYLLSKERLSELFSEDREPELFDKDMLPAFTQSI